MSLRAELTSAIAAARDRALAQGTLTQPEGMPLPEVGLERPANPEHGEWASNAAMQLAPVLRAAHVARPRAPRSGGSRSRASARRCSW